LPGAGESPAFWRTQEMLLIDQVVRPLGRRMRLDPSLSNLCGDWHVGGPEQRKATTVEPMKPMEPMEPMKPLSEDKWWPPKLGQPSTSGSQNDMRYAFFPEKRRLLIEQDGKLATYDSADHLISGVSQQQSSGRDLAFASQTGAVDLADLKKLD
jgi:hypothetical protein